MFDSFAKGLRQAVPLDLANGCLVLRIIGA